MSPEECVRCGACTAVCPVYRHTGQEGHSARGKMLVLAAGFAERPAPALAELLGRCLMCGACAAVCPRRLPLLETFAAARSRLPSGSGTRPGRRRLLRLLLSSPRLLELLAGLGIGLVRLELLPGDSGLWRKLGLPPPAGAALLAPMEPLPSPAAADDSIQLFAGCLARFLQPEIIEASRVLAARAGIALADLAGQACCGLAAWSAGDLEGARRLARHNIVLYRELPGAIITPCASCQVQLQRYGALLADDPGWAEEAARFSARVRGLFDVLPVPHAAAAVEAAGAEFPVFFHQSCHLRHHPELAVGPQQLLAARSDIRLLVPGGRDLCCGQGGLFQQAYPAASQAIFTPLYQQVASAGALLVVTSCSGCLLQWQTELAARDSGIRALHLAVFLAQA
ncbi:MAG: hypothetical protein BWK76_08865 [Desulfobulbaceae bacterium A2]|nr:MAG: hypothetical protein BWK76_08865 [Desulfobulbaceae bacterium A2]